MSAQPDLARTDFFSAPLAMSTDASALLTVAARCWRAARDAGIPVQQALHKVLAPLDQDMLTPAIDSLMSLYERAIGRKIVVGDTTRSHDEEMLVGLIAGTVLRSDCVHCSESAASSLDCAICSTRMMIAPTRKRARR